MAAPAPKPGSAGGARTVPAIVAVSVLAGAAMVAIVGTLLPGWVGITGAPAIWIPIVFYAVALIDVLVARWLWRRVLAARQDRRPVQRR
ncbi:MAG TPA: hypothetical protein VFZ03_14335 [Dongiaceae bacterium]